MRRHRYRPLRAGRGRSRRPWGGRVRRRRRGPGRTVRPGGEWTSGEGCDAADRTLPGIQSDLIDAMLATGAPVVLMLLTGRPYALGAYVDRVSAIVQGFFPGQRGGQAIAEVPAGAINPA